MLIFFVGLAAAQSKLPNKAAVKKREGENRRQRNVLLTAPYQYEVPKRQLNLPVKVPVNDYAYYTSHDGPEGKNFQYNSGPTFQQQQPYYENQPSSYPLKNPLDPGFAFQGFEGFPQFQSGYSQLGNFNKLPAYPNYQANYNYEKIKPAYSSFGYGNSQPFYNFPPQYSYNLNAYPTQQPQYAINNPYIVSHPQAALPPPIKTPDYALGYKGLSHYSSTSPAPVQTHKGLSNHASSQYTPQSSSVVSYSHNQKHPSKYNNKPIYEQSPLHTSFRGSAHKPFRASVQVLNPQGIYDSYGDQSITNEKPVGAYEYSLNQYAPSKQYLPAKEYLPVKEHTTESQYSTGLEPPHQTERPAQYLTPTKTYQVPVYQTPYLPVKVTTETPAVSTTGYYTTKSPYPSNQYLPATSQSHAQSSVQYSSPQISQYQQYTTHSDDSNQQYPIANNNNNYYADYDSSQQQAQYVEYVPQDSTTKK